MKSLLHLARFLCGEAVARGVFEPLVADWQREWSTAADSWLARIRIAVSGSTAFVMAILVCLVTGDCPITRRVFIKGLLTLALSSIALLAIQVALISQQPSTNLIFEVRVWIAWSRMLTFMIPLAMLPTMMLWRGLGLSQRAALIAIVGASMLTVFVTGWLVPKTQGQPPFSDRWQEATYQRMLANAAGSGRTARPSTPEQRAEARRRMRSDPRQIAFQAQQTRPRWNSRTFMFGGLTLALGTLGWALGGLGRTRPFHAVAWWALTCLAVMLFHGQLTYWIGNTGLRMTSQAPYWLSLVVFGVAAIVMLFTVRGKNARARA
jgi:apolipoprotein N-acyltransferase